MKLSLKVLSREQIEHGLKNGTVVATKDMSEQEASQQGYVYLASVSGYWIKQ